MAEEKTVINKQRSGSPRFKYALILLGILFFHIYMSYEIISKSEICRVYDESGSIAKGLEYYHWLFIRPNRLDNIKKQILTFTDIQAHPPFFATIQAIIWKLLKIFNKFNEQSIVLVTNGLMLFILLISVYGIGSILYNRNFAILSAFLVSFFPIIFGNSRIMMLDYPLACMTALSFYMLLKTNQFQSRKYSILSGIIFGLSQLTKESFIGFIFLPLAYYLYKSFKTRHKRTILLNSSLFFIFAIGVAGSVYLRPENFFAWGVYRKKSITLTKQDITPLLFYFKHAIAYTGTWVAFAIIPSLISYFKNFKSQNKVIFLWFFVPLMFFTMSLRRSIRFLIPALPALALIITAGVFSFKLSPKVRKAYVFLLVLLTIFQFFIYFFDLRSLDPRFHPLYFSAGPFSGILTYRKDPSYPLVLDLVKIFRKEENTLGKHKSDRNYKYCILFLFNNGEIMSPLEYKFMLEGLPFWTNCPQVADNVDAPEPGTVDWQGIIPNADYIMDKTGDIGTRGNREDVAGMLIEGFEKNKSSFQKIAEMRIYDGSILCIYKNLKTR